MTLRWHLLSTDSLLTSHSPNMSVMVSGLLFNKISPSSWSRGLATLEGGPSSIPTGDDRLWADCVIAVLMEGTIVLVVESTFEGRRRRRVGVIQSPQAFPTDGAKYFGTLRGAL